MKKNKQYEVFLKQFYFENGDFNFHKFDLFFIKRDMEFKNITETIKKKKGSHKEEEIQIINNPEKRKRKPRKKKVIQTIEHNNSLNNNFNSIKDEVLFLNLESVEEEEFFLRDLYPQSSHQLNKEGDNYYPFWLPEDEKYFNNLKSIITVKKECIPLKFLNKDNHLLLLQEEEDFLKIPINEIPKIKNKLEDFITNTNKLKHFEYKPSTPQTQYEDAKKNNLIYFNEIDRFFYDVFHCCSLATDNKDFGIICVDENDKENEKEDEKNNILFDYKLNFDKIKKYF